MNQFKARTWLAGWLSTRMIPASPLPPPATAHAALAQPSGRASLSRAVPCRFLFPFGFFPFAPSLVSRSLALSLSGCRLTGWLAWLGYQSHVQLTDTVVSSRSSTLPFSFALGTGHPPTRTLSFAVAFEFVFVSQPAGQPASQPRHPSPSFWNQPCCIA